MTANGLRWAVCRRRVRPGAWVGESDLCHVTHTNRRGAEACGIRRPGVHELVAVRSDPDRPRLYRVIYALSHAASGRLRPVRTLAR